MGANPVLPKTAASRARLHNGGAGRCILQGGQRSAAGRKRDRAKLCARDSRHRSDALPNAVVVAAIGSSPRFATGRARTHAGQWRVPRPDSRRDDRQKMAWKLCCGSQMPSLRPALSRGRSCRAPATVSFETPSAPTS
jgi:hypothetical protein